MKASDRKRLETAGWKVGTVEQFLGLTPAESAYIEFKLLLAKKLHRRRMKLDLTQQEAAVLLRSSQSRVAKMEAGDATVSVDLLVRALITLGVTPRTLNRTLDGR